MSDSLLSDDEVLYRKVPRTPPHVSAEGQVAAHAFYPRDDDRDERNPAIAIFQS